MAGNRFFLVTIIVTLLSERNQSSQHGRTLHSVRLPKWLSQPPMLTNIPFLPASDLGQSCEAGGRRGTCRTRRNCTGPGLTMASTCTIFKSYCCTDSQTCGGSSFSQVSYFHSPHYPNVEQEPVATCSSSIIIRRGVCRIRLVLVDFVLSVADNGCLSNLFTVIGQELAGQNVYCGDSKGVEVLVPVKNVSSLSLSFLVSRPGAKWNIEVTQEECDSEDQDEVDDVIEEVSMLTTEEPVKEETFSSLLSVCGVRKERGGVVLDRPRRSLLTSFFRTFPVKRFLWKEITRRKELQSKDKYQRKQDSSDNDMFSSLNSIANVRYSSATKHPKPSRWKKKTTPYSDSRLLFGHSVNPGEFPWLSSLEWNGLHICPAIIITSHHALSSATCLSKPASNQYKSQLHLVVLEHNLDLLDPGEFKVEVLEMTIHPEYKAESSSPPSHDIGVLTLSKQLTWSDTLSPACWGPLSPPTAETGGTPVYISWGDTQFGAASAPHWAGLPIIPKQECKLALSLHMGLDSSQVCAGPGVNQEEPCQGESGSPLVSSISGKMWLEGLLSLDASSSTGCEVTRLPRVFTSVSRLASWVASVTGTVLG